MIDDLKRTQDICRNIMIYFYGTALLFFYLFFDPSDDVDRSYLFFFLGYICFFIGTIELYGWIYLLRYKVVVSNYQINIKTLYKESIISLKEISHYTIIGYSILNGLSLFKLVSTSKSYFVYIQAKDEFISILEKNKIEIYSLSDLDRKRKIKNSWLSFLINALYFTLLLISVTLVFLIGKYNIFRDIGIIRYTWILLLCLPICISLFFFSFHLYKKGKTTYRKNIIYSIIFFILFLNLGLSKYAFTDINYNNDQMKLIQDKVHISLPQDVICVSRDFRTYKIYIAEITNQDEKNLFDKKLSTNAQWRFNACDIELKKLPLYYVQSFTKSDFYITYIKYYSNDLSYTFISYNTDIGRIMILDNYVLPK